MNDLIPKAAAESGHWYERSGKPAYEIVGANGNTRPTTLRDARKLDLVPSVTTIIRCAAAPALENWKIDQGILAALTLPRLADEPERDFLARVKRDSKEQARKAAERGTAIHGAIEGHFRGQAPDAEFWPHVKAATAEIPPGEYKPERSFAHPLGYGGKVDLHNDVWMIDYKSKDGDLPESLYPEHVMQLAAYRRGLGVHSAQCGILFVSRNEPVSAKFVIADQDELIRGLAMFDALLAYWRAMNKVAA